MTLFLTLLPLYLFGNLHCFGMCGPLVLMIGQHRFRNFYFLGRLLSFSLAGLIAGEAGAVLHQVLKTYHLAEIASFLFGIIILFIGISALCKLPLPTLPKLQKINRILSELMLKDKGGSTFLFGFFTVMLPCGQTLVVFTACALAGDALVGLFNGFAFALLTSPSLFLAMRAESLFKKFKGHYNTFLGVTSIAVAALAFCRGFAEIGWIDHWVINPNSSPEYHLIIY